MHDCTCCSLKLLHPTLILFMVGTASAEPGPVGSFTSKKQGVGGGKKSTLVDDCDGSL